MSVITCRSNVLRGARTLPRNQPEESLYNYVGGAAGSWQVTQMSSLRGMPLAPVTHVEVIKGSLRSPPAGASWLLSGLVRNTRHVSREVRNLRDSGRSGSVISGEPCAALIAVHRSAEWWELAHQVRREILDTQAYFLTAGLNYLSGMVRRWQNGRDLSEQFDGLTWFEYEPCDSAAFDDLLAAWRASEEWNYVDRECDVRLVRSGW